MSDPPAGQIDELILSPGTPYAERVEPMVATERETS